MSPSIAVLGSCIVDTITYLEQFPRAGETVIGKSFSSGCGGKGANQAVAASRLGAEVYLIGKVGDDLFGHFYQEGLSKTTVKYDDVGISRNDATGIAVITVDGSGENTIAIVPGANQAITKDDLTAAEGVIKQADILLCQCEVSMDVTRDALILARSNGVKTLMNAAPALPNMDPEIIKYSDILCVNETEAQSMLGKPVSSIEEARSASEDLVTQGGCGTAVITLGAQGAVFFSKGGEWGHVAAKSVNAVDCTGAGDAFVGALAYFSVYHSELSFSKKLSRSCSVASISVQTPGTQTSFPYKRDLPNDLFH